jgi:hypothetical protein
MFMSDFMKEINFAASISDFVRKINGEQGKTQPWVQLSILPEPLSALGWDPRLVTLFQSLLRFALRKNQPGKPIRVAFCKRTRMSDMESHFVPSPSFWIHARIKANGIEGFETGFKKTLQGLGYHCNGWVATNNSDAGLGAFCSGKDHETRLIAWIQNRKSCSKCDILIPIIEAA